MVVCLQWCKIISSKKLSECQNLDFACFHNIYLRNAFEYMHYTRQLDKASTIQNAELNTDKAAEIQGFCTQQTI